jgi:hypothetical protein
MQILFQHSWFPDCYLKGGFPSYEFDTYCWVNVPMLRFFYMGLGSSSTFVAQHMYEITVFMQIHIWRGAQVQLLPWNVWYPISVSKLVRKEWHYDKEGTSMSSMHCRWF